MVARKKGIGGSEANSLPAIVNEGYFSEYFLAYRLDAGLGDLYKRWESAERNGDSTPRTRVRSLSTAFDKYRAEAALASPDVSESEARLDLGSLPADGVESLHDLNDAILSALGWEPMRGETVSLTSADKTILVPVSHRCETPSGTLLLALETVFTTDPSTVVADKTAPAGTLLDPIRVGEKDEGFTVLEAAQLIFTADEPPNYLLICSGGAVMLLDRERWGEGVFLAADLDDAIARGDAKVKGELSAIAALFSADTINPGEDAQSVLTGLLDKAANESAGVSKELRHGVRRSVEVLANAVVNDVRYRQKGAWLNIDPDDLTRQCLRYLYRIIVLLFAEARPELAILPVDDPDYQAGYSLARLRDTALIDLHSDHARNRTHTQESLALLFRLVNDGYQPPTTLDTDARGLSFPGLGSTLFSDEACPLLDKSQIADKTLQQVLVNLCFTREKSGQQRQALSYATLGINQLGAVYEGLMAYKGFLATEELLEITNDGDPDTGSWVIPVDRADEFSDEVFLKEEGPDGQQHRVRYKEGDFVFRLSGRDRQRSASYYTPEVLTEFTVRHTLDVYWEEHPDITATNILKLTVCEPALGSGAFLNEAINQLAARYLKAAQDETGKIIDPDQYQRELQKAKAYFAINQAYGVDLNPTAVELAEVSLWLNCMHQGLQAPRFDARLRTGNSLIGTRRATYAIDQVKNQPWKKTKNNQVIPPADQPLHEVPLGDATGVHHFLLPGEGWGAAADATELKGKGGKKPVRGLAHEWSSAVRDWRKAVHKTPTRSQLERLNALARRVEAAWAIAARDAAEHHQAHNRTISLWGADPETLPNSGIASSTRFLESEGPATRLRMLMDAWCALWMWAPTNGNDLPSFDQWLDAAELLLGQPSSDEVGSLFTSHELEGNTLESVEQFGKASIAEIVERHPWLNECRDIAGQQAFFHWELEHPSVFHAGGFDIQIGNPPWVRLDWDEPACLAESDPWWGVTDLTKTAGPTKEARRNATLRPEAVQRYQSDRSENEGLAALLAAPTVEPELVGLRTNLYMVFMTNTWRRCHRGGVVGLLHPESHFIDPKAGALRSATYGRLRRHWQFANELFLFEDVDHHTEFGVNVYASERDPEFLQAVNLLAPATLDRSLDHDGTGETPSIQYPLGGWDLRPHANRVVAVNTQVLSEWVRLFDRAGTPPDESRLLRPLTTADLEALSVFAKQPNRLVDTTRFWTAGFNEKNQKDDGTMEWRTEIPSDLSDCILQGPHILNATPFGQQAQVDYQNNTDWDAVDLESLPLDHIPRTNYQRLVSVDEYRRRQTKWEGKPFTSRFREVHREFVGPGSARTLQSCILPPGPNHVHAVVSIALGSLRETARWASFLQSLPLDYIVKVSGTAHVNASVTDSFPIAYYSKVLDRALLLRALRLNCVTRAFEELWGELYEPEWVEDVFVAGDGASTSLADVDAHWTADTPLRMDYDRWLTLCEIDAIVALLLGLSDDQLVQMYRSQFAVLRKYESQMVFDGNGRQICGDYHAYGFKQAEWEMELKAAPARAGEKKRKMWDRVQSYEAGNTSVDLGPFIPPFRPADREKAMRRAYQAFARRVEADAS